jgi:hypothetical protein
MKQPKITDIKVYIVSPHCMELMHMHLASVAPNSLGLELNMDYINKYGIGGKRTAND